MHAVLVEVKGQLWGVSFLFHHVGSGDQTQVINLGSKCGFWGPILAASTFTHGAISPATINSPFVVFEVVSHCVALAGLELTP